MFLQAYEQGRKIGITRKNDELVKVGGVRKVVHTVHNKMDVGAGFAACGQGRAVYNLKGTADKGVAVFLISLRV